MRLIIYLICLAIILSSCFANRKSFIDETEGDRDCFYRPGLNAKERAALFPYNQATTIELVSFRCHMENYPVTMDGVIADSIIERKTLSVAGRDSISDILLNNFYTATPSYGIFTQCYHPRNAIVFYDSAHKVIAYIHLCFHCDQYRLSSPGINWGDECIQKVKMLRELFMRAGILFGTDLEIDEYPGEEFEGKVLPPINIDTSAGLPQNINPATFTSMLSTSSNFSNNDNDTINTHSEQRKSIISIDSRK